MSEIKYIVHKSDTCMACSSKTLTVEVFHGRMNAPKWRSGFICPPCWKKMFEIVQVVNNI